MSVTAMTFVPRETILTAMTHCVVDAQHLLQMSFFEEKILCFCDRNKKTTQTFWVLFVISRCNFSSIMINCQNIDDMIL